MKENENLKVLKRQAQLAKLQKRRRPRYFRMQFLLLKMPASLMQHPCWTQIVLRLGQSSKQIIFSPFVFVPNNPEVLAAIEAAELKGLVVPANVMASGKKSFTLAPNFGIMKHLKDDAKAKSIEIKFYPYLA